jgi:hypothetical protein
MKFENGYRKDWHIGRFDISIVKHKPFPDNPNSSTIITLSIQIRRTT